MADLTGRELSAIEDQLAAEQLLIRKYQLYSQSSADPQIKMKCEQIAARHRNHFERLLGQLN